MADIKEEYPRPDFVREALRWESLNGEWDFLFDDEDIGLSAPWYRDDLPNQSQGKHLEQYADQSVGEKTTPGSLDLTKDKQPLTKQIVNRKRKILVPFAYQTKASGINERDAHEVLWYEREILDLRTESDRQRTDRLLIRFGAIDYEATVWVDGQYAGSHQGGHVPFDVDITDLIRKPKARLTIQVRDSTSDLTQPRGKQYWRAQPESIWYHPTSGIWQTVWVEIVPSTRIGDSSHGTVLRSNDIESGDLRATIAIIGRRSGQKYSFELEATFHGVTVVKSKRITLPQERDIAQADINLRVTQTIYKQLPKEVREELPWNDDGCFKDGVALWSPTFPSLYDITIRLYDFNGTLLDSVKTQTGMRSLSWTSGDNTFLLNDKPLFQRLCLDQGYWPDSGLTPPTSSSCREDILLAQALGFNGCRKHQKLEDPLFLYYADKLGYLVWSEMASAYEFSAEYCKRFSREWEEAVKRDINHPCIITWTTANESWAYTNLKEDINQRNHLRGLYYSTKVLDPSRPINDNCGWEHVLTDLTTFHDYADASELKIICASIKGILEDKVGRNMFCQRIGDDFSMHKEGAPVICTEFGGVNIKPSTDEEGNQWGYTTASDSKDLLQRIDALVRAVIGEGTEAQGLVSGFVWTQLTDIEQEANGLYTFDRKPKIEPGKVKEIFAHAERAYFEGLAKRRSIQPHKPVES